MATTTASESRSAPLVNRTPRETHDEIRARIRLRQIEGAKRYADADRSETTCILDHIEKVAAIRGLLPATKQEAA